MHCASLLFTIIQFIILTLAIANVNNPGNSLALGQSNSLGALCQQGYFFNSQICIQCKQINGGYCQCSTYNDCETLVCNQGYVIFDNHCLQHPDSHCQQGGLAADGSSIVCFQCDNTSTLIGGICIQNNLCQKLDPQTGVCLNCQQGYFVSNSYQQIQDYQRYYLSLSFCEKCDDSCLTCSQRNTCTSCLTGYYIQSNSCYQCSSLINNCFTCNQQKQCLQCLDYYYLQNATTCAQCNSNCISCAMSSKKQLTCSNCQNGYYLSNNACIKCSTAVQNCFGCANSYNCNSCLSGFYLINNTCQMCSSNIEGCLYCQNGQRCSTCAVGYYLNNNICIKCSLSLNNCYICDNNDVCTTCQDGYYLENQNTCSPCSNVLSHCSTCQNNTKCISCYLGFYLSNNDCQPCSDNQCQECSDSSSCKTCNVGLQWDGQKCSDCSTQNCSSGCSNISYSTSEGCQQCSTYMNNCSACAFQGNTLQCSSCSSGSLISTPNSEPCSASQGLNCQQGQFPYGTNCPVCSSAIPNCSVCGYNDKNYLECTQCADGYQLGGQCEPCVASTQGGSSGTSTCNNCPTSKFYNNNNNSCDQCSSIQNCLSCSDSTTCTSCNPGYFSNNNNQCSLCASIILNCATCNNNQTCKECSPGYYLDGNICYHCSAQIQGCQVCTNNQTCKICVSGYYLNGNICTQCQDSNCLNCSTNTQICTQCSSGSYLDNQQCKSCSIIDGCISCSNNQKCTACKSGMTLNTNTNKCQQCVDQYCIQCNGNSSTCTNCIAGYYLNNNNGCSQCNNNCNSCLNQNSCNSCSEGYYLNGTQCSLCSTSINKCNACISSSICTSCDSGSYLSSGQCTQCPASLLYCASCINSSVCTACRTGAYLSGQTCQKCPDSNCLACLNSTTCTSCASNYQLTNGTCSLCQGYSSLCTLCSNGLCVKCYTGYTNFPDGTCVACPNHCYTGCAQNTQNQNYRTICGTCYDGYYLDENNQCQLCQTNQNQALRCNFDQNNKIITITQCQDGYFLVNNQCINAQNNNTCSKIVSTTDGSKPDSNNCLECWSNYVQNGQTCFYCNNCQANNCSLNQNGISVCNQCISQYYPDSNGICQPCPNNCVSCTSSNISDCSECQPGYFQGSNSCIACTTDVSGNSTCLNCQDQTNCSICKNGYYGLNGKCYSCQIGCNQCSYPGNICQSCQQGYYSQNGGCVLDLANCLSVSNGQTTLIQQNQTTGCQACTYGFYLVSGWLTQQTTSQIQNNVCLQCVNPDASFVCRLNPQQITVQSATIGTVPPLSTITTLNYFTGSTLIQPIGVARITTPSCQIVYFWTSQSCFPCEQTITDGLCVQCKNIATCDQFACVSGYYLVTIDDAQYCITQPNGCSKMNYIDDTYICTECTAGYQLVGNMCIQSNGCQTIDPNTGICMVCQAGYYFNWNFNLALQSPVTPKYIQNYFQFFDSFCSPCQITNCQTCPSAYTCFQCKLGYFWQESTINKIYANPSTQNVFIPQSNTTSYTSGQCVSCPKYCATCLNQIQCNSCFINFQISIDANNPDCTCPSNYTLDANAGTCTPKPYQPVTCNLKGCSLCSTDGTQCQACATNLQYALTGTTCTPCTQNCNSCTSLTTQQNTTICSECQDGYYKVQSTTDQPVTCALCSSASAGALRCEGILEGYSQFTIIQCQDSYYFYNNSCFKIPTVPTCYTISTNNNQSCLACLPLYTLYGTTCALCTTLIQNCVTCGPNSTNDGFICQSCPSGYLLNTQNNSCVLCPIGCQVCAISTIVNQDTSYICTTCANGNYLDEKGICQGCPFQCKTCSSSYYCLVCNDGFYLGESKNLFNSNETLIRSCYPCQSMCATCVFPGNICSYCLDGYVFYQGACIPNTLMQDHYKDPNMGLVVYVSSPINCNEADQQGCVFCLAGFFMDSQKVCRECISPYSKFVCNVQPVPPTPSPPPLCNCPIQNNTVPIQIGGNPTQPSSIGLYLSVMICCLLLMN